MKNSVVRLTAILTALMLMCSLLMVHEAKAAMGVYVLYGSQNVGDSTTVMWDVVPGADHYDCTVKNDTTGAYPRPRARADGIDCTFVTNTPGKYKIWVGAIDANGEVIDHGYAYWTVDESACDHDWDDDGFCDNCGKECPHNHGVIDSIALVRERSATNPSDDKHEIVYQDKCKVCRKILRERTVQQVHTYDQYGNCTMCGHSDHCPHSRKTLVEYGRSYEQDSAKEHEVKILYSWVCAEPNCGEVIDQIRDSETKYILEKHTFSNGICIRCNYSKKNDPVSASVSRGSSTGEVGGHIAAECTAKGGSGEYDYLWTITCDGAVVYSTLMWGNRASLTPQTPGQYRFSVTVTDRDTKETATATTDAITVTQPACGHVNTTEQSIGIVEAKRVSDKMHEVTYGFQRVCNDCHQEVGSWVRYEAQEHTFGASGSCTICGAAAPSACKHGSVGSEIISSEYISTSSDQMHYVVTTWKDYCNACGAVLNLTRETSITEGHSFAGSVCTLCHYAKSEHGCDHANTAFQPYSENPTISQQNDQTHLVKTRGKLCCADCGLVINDNDYTETYTAHTWSGNTCTACGYMKQDSTAPCTHASTTREQIDQVPKPESDERHVVITSYKVRCADCGAVLNERLDQDAYFYHTWNENTCVICGYVRTGSGCAHTSVLDEPVSDYHYTPVDGTQHIWSYTCRTICSLCDEVLQAGLEKAGYAAHVMNNHACTYCGYVDRVEVNRVQLNRWMNAENDQKHRITTVWHIVYSDGTAEDAEEVTYADHEYEKQTGYEAEHPHAIFRRCPCGYHPKTGATQYVASCPSCNPKQVTDNAQPEIEMIPLPEVTPPQRDCANGVHVYDEIVTLEQHPHMLVGRCECGTEIVYPNSAQENYKDCCACGNHAWGTPFLAGYGPEGNMYNVQCAHCNKQERVQVSAEMEAADLFMNFYTGMRGSDQDVFIDMAVEATMKMQDKAFVYLSEGTETFSDPGAALAEAGVNFLSGNGKETREAMQIAEWELIISNMLIEGEKYGFTGTDMDAPQQALDIYDMTQLPGDIMDTYDQFQNEEMLALYNEEIKKLEEVVKQGNATKDQEKALKMLQEGADDLQEEIKDGKKIDKFGLVMDLVGVACDAGKAANEVMEVQRAYEEMCKKYEENLYHLDQLIAEAKAVNNTLILEAAENVQANMFVQYRDADQAFWDSVWDATGTFNGEALEGVAGVLINTALSFNPLTEAIGVVGSLADLALNWSDAYESAYHLMELGTMSTGLQSDLLRGMTEKNQNLNYLSKLYTAIQIEGLNQSADFLQEWNEAHWVSISEFGYDSMEQVNKIIETEIEDRKQAQQSLTDVYTNGSSVVAVSRPTVEEISAVKAGVVRVHAVNGADIKAEAKAGSATYGHAPANATYTYMGTVGNYYLVKVGNGDQSYTAYIDKSLATLE